MSSNFLRALERPIGDAGGKLWCGWIKYSFVSQLMQMAFVKLCRGDFANLEHRNLSFGLNVVIPRKNLVRNPHPEVGQRR